MENELKIRGYIIIVFVDGFVNYPDLMTMDLHWNRKIYKSSDEAHTAAKESKVGRDYVVTPIYWDREQVKQQIQEIRKNRT